MKKSFLLIALLTAGQAFAQQRTIPYETVKALKARMTDLKSSLFLVDSLYDDYVKTGPFLVRDDKKSDLVEVGSTWIRNQYLTIAGEYPKQCPECKTKADELMRLNEQEIRAAEDMQYRKIVQKGDDYFQQQNYVKAREYYQRALIFRSSDPYPKQKLEEVEAILAGQEKKTN